MGARKQGIASNQRYHVVPRTLVFITNGDKVLLLKGAPDKRIWPNLYNGIGGHVEPGETVDRAVRREIWEETGIDRVEDLRLRGIITIDTGKAKPGVMLFVFTATSNRQEVRASDEGLLEWFRWQELPAEALVEDLTMLLPLVMEPGRRKNQPFFAQYRYNQANQLEIVFSNVDDARVSGERR